MRTPRGQSRSTRMRTPSPRAAGSYTRLSRTSRNLVSRPFVLHEPFVGGYEHFRQASQRSETTGHVAVREAHHRHDGSAEPEPFAVPTVRRLRRPFGACDLREQPVVAEVVTILSSTAGTAQRGRPPGGADRSPRKCSTAARVFERTRGRRSWNRSPACSSPRTCSSSRSSSSSNRVRHRLAAERDVRIVLDRPPVDAARAPACTSRSARELANALNGQLKSP